MSTFLRKDQKDHIDNPGFRVGLNEVTYLGLEEKDVKELAECFAYVVLDTMKKGIIREKILKIRKKYSSPKYSLNENEIIKLLNKLDEKGRYYELLHR